MTKAKEVVITEDAWKCMRALEESVSSLPDGDQKEKAGAALSYLSALFRGETLPAIHCPVGKLIIK